MREILMKSVLLIAKCEILTLSLNCSSAFSEYVQFVFCTFVLHVSLFFFFEHLLSGQDNFVDKETPQLASHCLIFAILSLFLFGVPQDLFDSFSFELDLCPSMHVLTAIIGRGSLSLVLACQHPPFQWSKMRWLAGLLHPEGLFSYN